MIPAELPANEDERLLLLEEHQLFITGREPEFDRIARNAANQFGVSTALVSLVLSREQRFLGSCGFELPAMTRRVSFCAHAILGDAVMVVPNAAEDTRFSGNPLVQGPPHIRFYAGAPLKFGPSLSVGTIGLIDPCPRDFPPDRQVALQQLADSIVDMIRLRLGARRALEARERAEERGRSLAEQRQVLSATLENIEHGVIVIGQDLRLEVYNENFFSMMRLPASLKRIGVSARRLLRAGVEAGFYGGQREEAVLAEHLSSIKEHESIRRTVRVGPDEALVEYTFNAMPEGRFVMVTTDVSARRRVEQMKDQFVSTVSHELRTPLTSIIGSLGLLEGGVGGSLDDRGRRLLGIARQNCARLGRLIDDLLDISKIEAGRLVLSPESVALGPFLREVIDQSAPYADRFGVRLELEASNELEVTADPLRLGQVVTNLLSNAIKFSPHGERVVISLTRRDGAARISVADRGPGIPPEFQGRVFQRFAQADSTDQRAAGGTGLGLNISRQLVDLMGGRIEFESKPGQGTVFSVDFPLARDGATERTATGEAGS